MSSFASHEAPNSLESLKQVVVQYVTQLLQGCGDTSCTGKLCFNGLRNATPSRPVRTYTPRSARAIAVAIASGPSPRRHLCAGSTQECPDNSVGDGEGQKEGHRDPSAFLQLHSDTIAVRELCSPSSHAATDGLNVLHRLHKSLSPLMQNSSVHDLASGKAVLPNDKACDIVFDCLRWLVSSLPQGDVLQYMTIDSSISRGYTYLDGPANKDTNACLSLLDTLHQESHMHLLTRTLEAVALRTELERVVDRAGVVAGNGTSVSSQRNMRSLVSLVTQRFGRQQAQCVYGYVLWLKRAFIQHWDGTSLLPSRSAALAALESLVALGLGLKRPGFGPLPRHDRDVVGTGQNVSLWAARLAAKAGWLPVITARVDIVEIAESWANTPADSTYRHLLAYQALFGPKERAVYFRTMNHLKMRKAHADAEKALELRRRVGPDDPAVMENDYEERHYMVIDVSRDYVLRDALDQVWQRRRSDLFRPLRVRLGEVDELEVGHDLGGVQIEFFNLLCKEAFREENQLFTTDIATGLSYFRPGSLQPLYEFELLGLLFALAVYNGATMPVNFPRTFYTLLRMQEPPCGWEHFPALKITAAMGHFPSDWPTVFKSLQTVLTQDVGELEYSFPLDANGLRLAVALRSKGQGGRKIVEIASVAPVSKHCETPIDVEALDWPGWKFEMTDKEPPLVTPENKRDYVADYLKWLLIGSVAPQLRAFLKGFHTIVDPHSLSIFTPDTLKAFVEGSARLDIDELRRAAQYDGYEARSRYIQGFWRVVGSWTEEKQKQLLKFVTAAERIPIGGASNLTFIIKRTAPGNIEHLPTSSTCFGTLQLPRYATQEILNEKLSLAIKYGSDGFGTG